MSDFDPNVAASIAAENTFQASQERPAAIGSEFHPHEPEIPKALDEDGRCWVCHLTLETEELRRALKTVRAECDLPDHIEEIIGDAIAFGNVVRAETLQTDRGGFPHNSVDSPRDTGMSGGAT